MDFSLTSTQQELAELASKIFTHETDQSRLRALDNSGYHDFPLWQTLAQAGLLGIGLEERYQGLGEGFETVCVLLEHAARAAAPVPLLEALIGGAMPIQTLGMAACLMAPLTALALGEGIITQALAEPGQTDPVAVKATATRSGEHWNVTGQKSRVALADQPGMCWTLARYQEGVGVFAFDLKAPGIDLQRHTGTSGEYVFNLALDGVSATLLVTAAQTTEFVRQAQLYQRAAAVAMACGVCAEMTRMGAMYSRERQQFGKPIGSFQAVAHALADCHIDTECLRSLKEQAVSLVDTEPQGSQTEEAVLCAAIFACEALHRVSHAVQQVHGGTGVDRDYPLFRYCLLAKKLELLLGGQAILLARLGSTLAA